MSNLFFVRRLAPSALWRAGRAALAVSLILAAPASVAADSFSVTEWWLHCNVQDSSTSEHETVFFITVENPFVNQHAVILPSNPVTTAAAQYDFAWAEEFGQFLIAAQLAAQDGNSVLSRASGTIYLQTDIDRTLSLDALLHHDLPTYGLYAYLGFGVRDLTTSQQLFSQSESWDSVLNPPGSGVLSITGNVVLPAGHQLRVNYGIQLYTFGASTGLATADGHVNFTITPEPSTLALLAAFTLIVPRRRHRLV